MRYIIVMCSELPTEEVKEFAMKLRGFTLAEVLITLGIIGVIAAMTLPTLITNYQKRATIAKLKRAYSVIKQAYLMSYDQVGDPAAEEAFAMGADTYFKTYWAPFIKATHCKSEKACGYNKVFPFLEASGEVYGIGIIADNRSTFYTSDGFLYVVFVGSGAIDTRSANTNIIVDINGGKGANTFGKDVFCLQRIADEKGNDMQFCGYKSTDPSVNCSKKGNGLYCAEKIRRDGWKILKDYPW